jgi:hypothetical protein
VQPLNQKRMNASSFEGALSLHESYTEAPRWSSLSDTMPVTFVTLAWCLRSPLLDISSSTAPSVVMDLGQTYAGEM